THTEAIERIIMMHPPIRETYQWDDIKDDIKTYCKKAGKTNKAKRAESICNLTNRLNKLQRSTNPNTATIEAVTNRLKILEQANSEAMAIRARIKWREEGEQSTRYFMQQFHHFRRKTTINSLQIPPAITPQLASPIPSPFYSYTRHMAPPTTRNEDITSPNTTEDMDEILTYAATHFKDQWSLF